MKTNPHVAIVGATGAVGVEMLQTLERRNFPVGDLTLLASARSVGKTFSYKGQTVAVKELTKDAFRGVDLALFSAGGGLSKEFAPLAAAEGCVAIDNSSAFRMDEGVPLVVPEINPDDARRHNGVIANPNCSTIIALMALHPLHQAFGVARVFAATYQAVSGSGAQGLAELQRQIGQIVRGEEPTRETYPHQIAFNLLPHVDAFLESGYTREEMKMENESRKIMHVDHLKVSCTCVRVPVYRSHSIAVNAEFERPVDLAKARDALEAAAGVDLCDEPDKNLYPTPLQAAERDNCAVGRLRRDRALSNGLAFWVCGDQLLKGAALNAVQIAELLIQG